MKSGDPGTQDGAAAQTFKQGIPPTIDGSAIKVESPDVQKLPVMLLGDSVLLGVSQWIGRQLNVVKVDAVVGRQEVELQRLIGELAQAGELQPVVILNLGNNGVVEESTLRAILTDQRNCQRVVVVNTRVPRRWQDADDALMARVVPEYFGPDGVHAGTLGAKAYAELVISALALPPLSRP